MSTYKPEKQGRRDARNMVPPRMHWSETNQHLYDIGYAKGTADREKEEAQEANQPPTLDEIVINLMERIEQLEHEVERLSQRA